MNNELLSFETPELHTLLSAMSAGQLDTLPFGVIGFDANGHIQHYNAYEAKAAMFDPQQVIGRHVFVELAPCFNNFLVATRFEDATAAGQALDETMPYVLTFRMRPTRAQIRLLAKPAEALRFILVLRTPAPAKV
jgi:photoactive yellow protein